MISTIWGLLTGKVKAILGIGLTVVVIAIYGTVSWQYHRIEDLKADLIRLESTRAMEKALYDNEVAQAHLQITNQNEAIDQYRLDAQSYSDALARANEQIQAEKEKSTSYINSELAKDSSDTNQLRLIRNVLEDFSNAE